jgi:hypothetical protein
MKRQKRMIVAGPRISGQGDRLEAGDNPADDARGHRRSTSVCEHEDAGGEWPNTDAVQLRATMAASIEVLIKAPAGKAVQS